MSWEFCHYLYQMQLILPSIYALLFITLILKMNFFVIPSVTKLNLVLLFILKIAAAIAVGLIYTYYYTGADFNSYFLDSKVMIHNLAKNDNQTYLAIASGYEDFPLLYSSKIMIFLNAFLQIFSFGNIYVHFLFFCYFSFIGLTALLKIFLKHFPLKKQIVIALFFIPGILFWGSAPLKESVIIGATGLLIYFTDFGLNKKYSVMQVMYVLLLIGFIAFLKIYVLMALLPAMACNLIVSLTSDKLWLLKYTGVIIIFSLAAFLLSSVIPDLDLSKQISDKQAKSISEARGGVFLVNDKNFISIDYSSSDRVLQLMSDSTYRINDGSSYLKWELNNMADTTYITNSKDTAAYRILYSIVPANSIMPVKRVGYSYKQIIFSSPFAFVNTLIHPTLFEINSSLYLICAIENLLIIVIILSAIIFFDRSVLKKKEIIFFCFTFAIIIYALIGITVPTIGAMVRYKTIGELFLASACFLMIDQDKLRKAISRK
jgi:hypothetical protein